jgi:DNA (cytosine-5)-methyltransferase 1
MVNIKYERDPRYANLLQSFLCLILFRNALPFNMLSFVEALQPNLFLLENVVGLVHSCVTSDAVGRVVKSGTVKLICRCLVALGYQVHFKILEAGQYGVAQERERLIFFAAKRGQTLPDFPIPTHAFHKAPKKTKIPPRRSDFVEPPKRSKDPSDFHLFAPEAAVTVDDAISDLVSGLVFAYITHLNVYQPLFDW